MGSRTIALTGATGAIGSRFLTEAANRGYRVKAFSRTLPETSVPGIEWHSLDLCKSGQNVEAALAGAECVIHLAAYTPVDHENIEEAALCWQANVLGTYRLIEAMAKAGVPRMVQAVAGNIYSPEQTYPDERSSIHPQSRTFYLSSKVAQEWCAEPACGKYGIALVNLRISSVFGGGRGGIDAIANKLLAGQAIELNNDGQYGADFISCDDVSAALFLMLENDSTGTFNVGSGERFTMRELVSVLTEIAGLSAEQVRLLPIEGTRDPGFPAIDITKIKALGFRPTSLRDNLATLVEELLKSKAAA